MKPPAEHVTLDPDDWNSLRRLGHAMLDDMFDYLEHIRERPVWQSMPAQVRQSFAGNVPAKPTDLSTVYRQFSDQILPYSTGNVHPGFMGWVHGGGTAVGMLAEMLAGGLNSNLGGRDHAPIEVERQVVEWTRQIFGFPHTASGLFLTGTSMANFVALLVARNAAFGARIRPQGIALMDQRLVAYTSSAAHGCIGKAMDMAGLGTESLRRIPVDSSHRIQVLKLREAIARDRAAGLRPFLLVGTAGTVDIGAIDDLEELSQVAAAEGLWFHVDGAFGALAILAPELAPQLRGIEKADSLAFDFHKWAQVPYDAGFVLVRDGQKHFGTFATPAAYLQRELRGLAAGDRWPCDFGPDLSRGFRSLKTWFTLKVYGTEQLGAVISQTCELAQYLKHLIERQPALELAAPVQLNIVCFRFRNQPSDQVTASIVADIQESGIAVPSTTTLEGRLAIRAAIVNHRTRAEDLETFVTAVLRFGAPPSTRALTETELATKA